MTDSERIDQIEREMLELRAHLADVVGYLRRRYEAELAPVRIASFPAAPEITVTGRQALDALRTTPVPAETCPHGAPAGVPCLGCLTDQA